MVESLRALPTTLERAPGSMGRPIILSKSPRLWAPALVLLTALGSSCSDDGEASPAGGAAGTMTIATSVAPRAVTCRPAAAEVRAVQWRWGAR